jgi:hypothetical protein
MAPRGQHTRSYPEIPQTMQSHHRQTSDRSKPQYAYATRTYFSLWLARKRCQHMGAWTGGPNGAIDRRRPPFRVMLWHQVFTLVYANDPSARHRRIGNAPGNAPRLR